MKKIMIIIICIATCILAQSVTQYEGLICGTENMCIQINDPGDVWLQLSIVPSVSVGGALTRENWKYYIPSIKKSTLALIFQAMNSNACIGLKYVIEGNLCRITDVWLRKGW